MAEERIAGMRMSESPETGDIARLFPLRRYTPVAVALCAGVALCVTLFYIVREQEQARTQAEFERQTNTYVATIQKGIERNLEVLESVGGLFTTSPDVTRQEFREFVESPLSRHDEIQALSWNELVMDRDRASFEAAARNDGLANFQIRDRKAQGQMARAAPQAEYVVVRFIEPFSGNEAAVGFDVASNSTRAAAMASSRDTGEMVATGRIVLVQETEEQFGFLIFKPIYKNGARVDTVEQRRQSLRGFAVGVFRIGDMVEAALKGLPTEIVDIEITDEAGPPGERALYQLRAGGRDAPTTEQQSEARNKLVVGADLQIPGRKWSVLFTPTEEFFAVHGTGQPWGVLASGLLITALLGAYLLSMINHAGKIEGLAAELSKANEDLQREITRRGRAEEELKEHSSKLEEMVEQRTRELRESQAALIRAGRLDAIGQLAAGVAHELNNPLGAIVGYSDIVLEQGSLDNTSKDYVARILKRAEQAAKIVRQLNGFAQPSEIQKGNVDLGQVIQESIEMVAEQMALQGVKVALHLDPQTGSMWADSDYLQQVFLNVALNAKDAMPQGGQLVVTTRPSEDDRSVEIAFADTGVGIPEENLEKVFEPFFTFGKSRQETDSGPSATEQIVQGHVGLTRVGSRRGTGLGLSISQRIVQDHGGHMKVESVEGRGATFTVVLPRS